MRFSKRLKGIAEASDVRLATKLLVRFKNGTDVYGTTYKIDPDRTGFNLVVHGAKSTGEERYVEFADVKYVALVTSFRDEKPAPVHEYQPKGSEVSVTFKDGEVLKGYTLKHYSDKDPRFSVIPSSAVDNRISTIVERSAVGHMALGRIPKTQELRTLMENSVKRLIMHYYWRHPDSMVTLAELASRLGRAAAVVDRELGDFIQEGFVQRVGPPSAGQLRFVPPRDPTIRQLVSSMGREIDQLYFRKRQQPETPKAAPSKPAIRWPL